MFMRPTNVSLGVRIFICFLLTIFYVMIQAAVKSNKDNSPKTETTHSSEVKEVDHRYEKEVDHRYEVRIGFSDYTYSNGTWKDTIFTSLSLKESEKYLNEHKAVHTALVIYDLVTGDKVASSD